jgi:hypothetical protein
VGDGTDLGGDTAWTRLRIERSGGLAGLRASATVDATALTADQTQALATLRAAAQGRALRPAAAASAGRGADRFAYRVHLVLADGSSRTLDVAESDMPEALSALAAPILPR